MSPDLREVKFGQVDVRAAREKAGVEYIIGLIEASEPALRQAFIPEDTPEDEVLELLFAKVSQTLGDLGQIYVKTVGIDLCYRPLGYDGSDVPSVRLGWARFHEALSVPDGWPRDKNFPHMLRLTETGIEVIDGLRTAQSYITLEEQRRVNQESWNQAIQAIKVVGEVDG